MKADFRIYKSSDIDKVKWDACISSAGTKMAYGFYEFLNIVCDDWLGIVWDEYAACLALPYKQKLGGKWLLTPPFAQQILIYGDDSIVNHEQLEHWINKHFKLIMLNSRNLLFRNTRLKTRTNLTIDLKQPYAEIRSHYLKPAIKNLRKSEKCGLVPKENIDIELVCDAFDKAYGALSGIKKSSYEKLRKLHLQANHLFEVKTYGIYKESELVFAAALLLDSNSIYYILAAPTKEGRKCSVTYYFIDLILKAYAGKMDTFDFEGSDLPNVATFYKSFGPKTENYTFSFKNNYPFPFNQLINKKLKIQ